MSIAKSVARLFRETIREWLDDGASNIAAALAYYAIFSLSPLLIIFALTLGLVMDRSAVETGLIDSLEATLGQQAGALIRSLLDSDVQSSDVLGTIVWFGIVIWGASGMFAQLQNALNKIWEVKPKPGRSPLVLVKNRVLSFVIVVITAVSLLGMMIVHTALNSAIAGDPDPRAVSMSDHLRSAIVEEADEPLSTGNVLAIRAAQLVISVTITTVLIAAVYAVLPDVEIHWRDVLVGSLFTSVLLFVGQFAVGLYLSRVNVGSVFGAAGSLTVILVWVYYSAQILLFGAEFTEVWARHHGFYIRPDDDATWENEYKARYEANRAGRDWAEIDSSP
jgi:membrane protein